MSGALGFEFVTPPDPTLTVQNFDFERDPLRMQPSSTASTAPPTTCVLKGFVERGGKLLLVHGMADPIFSALETVDYQQRLSRRPWRRRGIAFRAHLPRAGHEPLRRRPGHRRLRRPVRDRRLGRIAVRRPSASLARGSQALPGLARPLCHYPKVARYIGGESRLSSSFDCR
jgi:hypothetical protein